MNELTWTERTVLVPTISAQPKLQTAVFDVVQQVGLQVGCRQPRRKVVYRYDDGPSKTSHRPLLSFNPVKTRVVAQPFWLTPSLDNCLEEKVFLFLSHREFTLEGKM